MLEPRLSVYGGGARDVVSRLMPPEARMVPADARFADATAITSRLGMTVNGAVGTLNERCRDDAEKAVAVSDEEIRLIDVRDFGQTDRKSQPASSKP